MPLNQMNGDVRSSYKNPDTMLYQVAAMAYGEMSGKSKKHKRAAISSFMNRVGEREWKGQTTEQILDDGYYAVQDKNDPFVWATTKKFPDKSSENEFKKTLALASAMFRGKVDSLNNQFFFTKDEIKKLKKDKKFDFTQLESAGDKIGKYYLFKYKEGTKPKQGFDTAFANARKKGKKTFMWGGKKYNTKLAK